MHFNKAGNGLAEKLSGLSRREGHPLPASASLVKQTGKNSFHTGDNKFNAQRHQQ